MPDEKITGLLIEIEATLGRARELLAVAAHTQNDEWREACQVWGERHDAVAGQLVNLEPANRAAAYGPVISTRHARIAIGYLSQDLAELAERAGDDAAPGWFPDGPAWGEAWQHALDKTFEAADRAGDYGHAAHAAINAASAILREQPAGPWATHGVPGAARYRTSEGQVPAQDVAPAAVRRVQVGSVVVTLEGPEGTHDFLDGLSIELVVRPVETESLDRCVALFGGYAALRSIDPASNDLVVEAEPGAAGVVRLDELLTDQWLTGGLWWQLRERQTLARGLQTMSDEVARVQAAEAAEHEPASVAVPMPTGQRLGEELAEYLDDCARGLRERAAAGREALRRESQQP